jgi:hypothetical protein
LLAQPALPFFSKSNSSFVGAANSATFFSDKLYSSCFFDRLLCLLTYKLNSSFVGAANSATFFFLINCIAVVFSTDCSAFFTYKLNSSFVGAANSATFFLTNCIAVVFSTDCSAFFTYKLNSSFVGAANSATFFLQLYSSCFRQPALPCLFSFLYLNSSFCWCSQLWKNLLSYF